MIGEADVISGIDCLLVKLRRILKEEYIEGVNEVRHLRSSDNLSMIVLSFVIVLLEIVSMMIILLVNNRMVTMIFGSFEIADANLKVLAAPSSTY